MIGVYRFELNYSVLLFFFSRVNTRNENLNNEFPAGIVDNIRAQ